ncbi:MAG: hypothetical protein IJU45_05850 [Clostridia bacterium]|nr:hypothetical protein [Clostridia bacterium]
MKKYLLAFLIIAVLGTSGFAAAKHFSKKDTEPATTAPSTSQDTQASVNSADLTEKNDVTTTLPAQQDKEYTFDAELLSVTGNSFELESKSAAGGISLKSKVRATVENKNVFDENGKTVRDDDFENFRAAKVTFYGDVMETYPLMVHAEKIVLSQRERCNVYFYFNGKIIKTLAVEVGASIDSADMPRAGAYCDDGYHFESWIDESGKPVYALNDINDSVVLNAKISHD